MPDRTSPSQKERKPNTLRYRTGARPKAELSWGARTWPELDPLPNQTSPIECDLDMLGLPSGSLRRQLARTRDSVPTVLPHGPYSDGILMNRLEEGALGDPVLAGNLVYNPDGRGDIADHPVANHQPGRNKLERAVAQQGGTLPKRLGPMRCCITG